MVKLYYCKNCEKLVEVTQDGKCPYCGSENLTDKWDGLIIIIDPENSEVAKFKNIKEEGFYPIIVRE